MGLVAEQVNRVSPPEANRPGGAPAYRPSEHPLLPVPTEEELAEALSDPGRAESMLDFLREREKRISKADEDPFRYGFELDHWKVADRLLSWVELVLFIFGGNRSAKSEYASKRIVQNAVQFPDSILMCLHESEESSIETQQKLVWKYLPPEIKRLNDRRNSVFKVRYSQAGGFTEGKLVLPNRSEIHFVSYKQDPGMFEGWELGVKPEWLEDRAGQANMPWAGLGAWADENMPLPWVKMLLFRLASRAGKLAWTFTPVNGMTPTIKDLVGKTPKTIESRPAELLADRVNVAGLPVGHMPFVQEPLMERSRVIYFHSILNPFGKHYEQIRKLCAGKPSGFVEIRAYGFCRDSVSRAFPNFSEVNIIEPEHLPLVGTNYKLTDPAGGRNWATVWVRVTPGNPPDLYIYRDWPDVRHYGEWAVTATNPKLFDGEPGPAQIGLGYGVVRYKQLWLGLETISGDRIERDPYRREGLNRLRGQRDVASKMRSPALRAGAGSGVDVGDPYDVLEVNGKTVVREWIFARYIDPRAGRNQHVAERGGTCLVDEFDAEQRNPKTGEVEGPRMIFQLASGVDINEGVTKINDLLYWNTDLPLCKGVNAPRLFVSSECQQVIWALQNWTGEDGEKGACKDFIDLVRYMAMGELRYVPRGGLKCRKGGTY